MSAILADTAPNGPEAGPRFNPIAWKYARRALAQQHAEQVRGAAGERRERLRAAHQERAAAEAEIARLRETLARARDHLAAVEVRHAEAEAAGLAADDDAVAELAAALATGGAVPAAAAAAPPAPAEREQTIATAALARLTDKLEQAEQRLAEAKQRVGEAAWGLLEDFAVSRARDMLAEQEAMRAQRAELRQIWDALHGATAKLFGEPVDVVAEVFRAVQAADPPEPWRSSYPGFSPPVPPNPWTAILVQLIDDPEVVIPE